MLDAVRGGLGEIPAIVALLYADVDEKLHKPAGRSVLVAPRQARRRGLGAVAGGERARLKARYEAV